MCYDAGLGVLSLCSAYGAVCTEASLATAHPPRSPDERLIIKNLTFNKILQW